MPAITQARISPGTGQTGYAATTGSLSLGIPGTAAAVTISAARNGVMMVNAVGSADIVVSGAPITGTGTLIFALAPTGVVPGTYTQVLVDSRGRVTAGSTSTLSLPDPTSLPTSLPGSAGVWWLNGGVLSVS